jgi:hypothetical protein
MDVRALLVVGCCLLVLAQSGSGVALHASPTPVQTAPLSDTPLTEPPVERWTATYGRQGTERAFSVVSVADGYVVGGSTTSFDTRSDMWVVHVDADGRQTWTRSLGTAGSERVRDLVATDDGGVLVVGQLGATEGSRLYKLDTEGTVEWSRLFGSDHLARAAVAVDGGGYVVVGSVAGEGFSRPGAVAFVSPEDDVRIDRLTGRSVAVESFTAITETSDGDLLLAGESDRGEGDVDAWVVKLASDGTVRWNRLASEPNAELHPAAVTELPNGDVLVAGVKRRGTVDDGWLARLDGRTGKVVWRTTYDRLSFDDVTANGRGALVAGSTFESRVTRDALLLSVDGQGRELWRQTYGGSRDDVFTGLAATPTGYLLAGWTDTGEERREDFFAVAVDRPVTVTGLDVSPRSVTVGEQVTVTATLTNRADDRRRHETTLVVDGEQRDSRTTMVSVGNETTVSFVVTFETSGTHTVSVDEGGPIVVDVAPASTPTATAEPTPTSTPVPTPAPTPTPTTETTSPGFGVGAALVSVVLLTVAVWAVRWRRMR